MRWLVTRLALFAGPLAAALLHAAPAAAVERNFAGSA